MASRRLLRPTRSSALSGLSVAIYLVLFALASPTLWHRIRASPDHLVALGAGGALALLWFALLVRLVIAVFRLRHSPHADVAGSGVVWLASCVVALLSLTNPFGSPSHGHAPVATTHIARVAVTDEPAPFAHVSTSRPSPLLAPEARPSSNHSPITATTGDVTVFTTSTAPRDHGTEQVTTASASEPDSPSAPPSPAVSEPLAPPERPPLRAASIAGSLPLALVAKRRRDSLRRSHEELENDDVDDAIGELRYYDEGELRILRRLIGEQTSGLLVVASTETDDGVEYPLEGPVVVVVIAVDEDATLCAFAQPGNALPLGPDAASLVDNLAVVLSRSGQCHVATTPEEALRFLALRLSLDDVVLYLGPHTDLDPEIAQRCVTLGDGPHRRGSSLEWGGRVWSFAAAVATAPTLVPTPYVERRVSSGVGATIRVQLLRAEPTVSGLHESFAPTLRRRCVEMTAYLAVHAHEPVTGDRLRARVLGSGDDASLRTLSNTATAVRRSLGSNDEGPRLHAVTPAGLYHVHDVDSDVTEFHRLVAAAREPFAQNVAATLQRALALVQGEPLATALRGFEWFLAEGHLARLQRDGEWAALRLAAEARDLDDFDLAFWAIEQGRLIDPYSETLEAALHRVPRLREFGGDRPGGGEHLPIGAR